MIESDDLVNLERLNVAEKNPIAPASKERALLLIPRAEPPVSVTNPSEQSTSEPEEAVPPGELTFVPRWRPLTPPGFTLLWVDESDLSPPEQADWPMRIPLGVQLVFASLGPTGKHITFSSEG